MNKTTIFFDLDGTLIENVIDTIVFPEIANLISNKTGMAVEDIIDEFERENERRLTLNTDIVWAMNWDDITLEVAQKNKVENIPSVSELVVSYATTPYTKFIDNARDILIEISLHKNRRLYVASKGLSRYQFPQIKSLGVFDIFDGFLMPDITGHHKNTYSFYKSQIDAETKSINISVGDNYLDDIIFPASIGFSTILKSSLYFFETEKNPLLRPSILKRKNFPFPGFDKNIDIFPTAVVTHLKELPDVISKIELVYKNI